VAVQVLGNVETWTEHVKREKAVLHALSMFHYGVTHKCLIAEGWCATAVIDDARDALRRGSTTEQTVLSAVKTRETPPDLLQVDQARPGSRPLSTPTAWRRTRSPTPPSSPSSPSPSFEDGGSRPRPTTRCLPAGVTGRRHNILLMGAFAVCSGFDYDELLGAAGVVGQDGLVRRRRRRRRPPQCRAVPGGASLTQQKRLRSNIAEACDLEAQATLNKRSVHPFCMDPRLSLTKKSVISLLADSVAVHNHVALVQGQARVLASMRRAAHLQRIMRSHCPRNERGLIV
jgi:hypothetical protein